MNELQAAIKAARARTGRLEANLGESFAHGWTAAINAIERDVARRHKDKEHRPGPLARKDDPESSHEGARRIEPKRNTRKREVLDLLRLHQGEWVPAHMLHTQSCGGSEGLRRVRELRNEGWPIEVEYTSGSDTRYRMIDLSRQLEIPL